MRQTREHPLFTSLSSSSPRPSFSSRLTLVAIAEIYFEIVVLVLPHEPVLVLMSLVISCYYRLSGRGKTSVLVLDHDLDLGLGLSSSLGSLESGSYDELLTCLPLCLHD